MSTLREYLIQKRSALLRRRAEPGGSRALEATVSAEGRSGVRRIRIRDFQVISDSPADFAGYNLGPSSPELQLGVLGSCLTHSFLIQAADLEIPIDAIHVNVHGEIDSRSGQAGYENIPVYPHNIAYDVQVESPAPAEDIRLLHETVEARCPILNLLANPQTISGAVHLHGEEASSLTVGNQVVASV